MAGKSHKAQYYVWYLGWKECHGLSGREFTEPIVRELLVRRRSEELPKLTIEIAKKELKVVQLVEKKRGKIEKVKYPAIPARDITYASQAMYPDEDVVSCIYLGFNDRTQCAVHTHVYRCDSPDTAALFVENIRQLVLLPEHQKRVRKIEQELFEKGQIMLRPSRRSDRSDRYSDEREPQQNGGGGSGFGGHGYPPPFARQNSGGSSGGNSDKHSRHASDLGRSDSYRSNRSNEDNGSRYASSTGSEPPYSPRSPQSPHSPTTERMPPVFDDAEGERREAERESEVLTLADELKARLGSRQQAPLLLPPKDYDTVHRKQGNLIKIEARKCLNKEIVGKSGMYKIASDDSARGDSDGSSHKNSYDEDEETVIIGQSNQPAPRLQSYEPHSPLHDPVVYSSENRKPFSPGPHTNDLKRNSYFPSKEDLPNYLPSSREERGGPRGAHHGRTHDKRPFRKQQSSPEFRNLPDNQRRHHDEGYTSMGRQDYPPGYFDDDPYGPPQMNPPLGGGGIVLDLSQPVPPMAYHGGRRGSSNENMRRTSRENIHSPRGGAYPGPHEPPIDYTVANRKHKGIQRTGSGYY